MDKLIIIKGSQPLMSLCMLIGKEGLDWCYEETDPGWWALRLYLRRN